MNVEKLVRLTAVTVFLLVCGGVAKAQVWNENSMAWDGPTTCTTGEPITACPVTGYKVERASSATGTFTQAGVTTATTFKHTGVTAGSNCYRVRALYAGGETVPTSVLCFTNTPPAGPPNPPTNLRVVNSTVFELYYDTRKRSWLLGDRAGFANVGAACLETRFKSTAYYEVSKDSVRLFDPRNSSLLFAKCG